MSTYFKSFSIFRKGFLIFYPNFVFFISFIFTNRKFFAHEIKNQRFATKITRNSKNATSFEISNQKKKKKKIKKL